MKKKFIIKAVSSLYGTLFFELWLVYANLEVEDNV